MADKKYNIVITATDRASAVVRRFNARVAETTKPLNRTFQSFQRLGREIGKNPIAKGLGNVASLAGRAAGAIGTMTGALAGVGLAITATKVAEWTADWAQAGAQLTRFSAITGIASSKIQSLRGAGKQWGIQAQDMDSSLQGLGDRLEGSIYGRAPEVVVAMNRLQVHIKRTKTGAIDTAQALYDVADAIAKIKNVQAQALAAQTFGLEPLLPLLQKGSPAIKAAEAAAIRNGVVVSPETLAKQKAYADSLNQLSLAFDGLGNSIGNRFIPVVTPAVDGLAKMVNGMSKAVENHTVTQKLMQHAATSPSLGALPGGGLVQGSAILALVAQAYGRGIYNNRNPRGIRNNNPGNLRSWGSAPVVDGYAQFPTALAGISALTGQLMTYGRRGLNTIASIVKTYAPAGDHNNVAAYVADMVKRTGYGANQQLDMANPHVLESLDRAIIAHENGKQPYSGDLIKQAIENRVSMKGTAQPAHVVVQFKNTPKGVTVDAPQKAGAPTTELKIDYALPEGRSP